jgi:hypothetical protein
MNRFPRKLHHLPLYKISKQALSESTKTPHFSINSKWTPLYYPDHDTYMHYNINRQKIHMKRQEKNLKACSASARRLTCLLVVWHQDKGEPQREFSHIYLEAQHCKPVQLHRKPENICKKKPMRKNTKNLQFNVKWKGKETDLKRRELSSRRIALSTSLLCDGCS